MLFSFVGLSSSLAFTGTSGKFLLFFSTFSFVNWQAPHVCFSFVGFSYCLWLLLGLLVSFGLSPTKHYYVGLLR